MKKQIILGSFLALGSIASAQVWTTNSGLGQETTPGNVGIGTSIAGDKLHVVATNNNGISITQSTFGGANLTLQNTQLNGRKFVISSLGPANTQGSGHFTIYDVAANADRFFINGPTGNVGIGTISPVEKLSVSTAVMNDGISITQTAGSASALHMYNTSAGGNHWALFSTGNGNVQGSGNFSIFQYGASDRLFINGTTGKVGIGTIVPTNARLEIREDANTQATNRGIYSDARNTTWTSGTQGAITGITTGLYGIAGAPGFPTQLSDNYGVIGIAQEGNAYGGYFSASTTGGPAIYGVYASASYPTGSAFAGYFQGNVYRSGTDNFTSDRKLKNDIQPLGKAMERLMQLKPSSYTFKTEEYKSMNLPQGKQMGLIAQDLENVFPELVTEMPEIKRTNEKGERELISPSFKSVQYISLIPVLIAGIQEQQKMIEQQSQINADQQKQLEEQKHLIDALTQKVSGTTGLNSINVETGVQMSQNEPNPFTHETVVKYTLPQTISNAFMAVYDLTGKQITYFPINEKGASSLTITSEKLAAGIYIYSIVADGKVVDSKRMIVAEK